MANQKNKIIQLFFYPFLYNIHKLYVYTSKIKIFLRKKILHYEMRRNIFIFFVFFFSVHIKQVGFYI